MLKIVVPKSGLKIIKKHKEILVDDTESKGCRIQLNANYAWDAQWYIDDLANIPRKVRGTDKDRRTNGRYKSRNM